MADNVVKPSG
jgi:hypothetical protein